VTQPIDFLADLGFNPQLLLKLSPERSLELFTVPDFAAGEFPLKAVGVGAVPLANQDFLPAEEDSCGYQNGFSLNHRKMTFYQTSPVNSRGTKTRMTSAFSGQALRRRRMRRFAADHEESAGLTAKPPNSAANTLHGDTPDVGIQQRKAKASNPSASS